MGQRRGRGEGTEALRLGEVERVILGRLAGAVSPDQKELQVVLLRAIHVLIVLEYAQQRHDNEGKSSATLHHPIMDNPMFLDTILIALNMPSMFA